jgi:uncharacterized membrane protein YoaK (UPF0700 family)
MTTTVLTMTLTGVGSDLRAVLQDRGSAAERAARGQLGRRLLVIATMFAGAIAAASLVLNVSPLSALVLATALLAVTFSGTVLAARRPGAWRAAT